jgi:hypothetical protein
VQRHASERGVARAAESAQNNVENLVVRRSFVLFREPALVAAQWGGH